MKKIILFIILIIIIPYFIVGHDNNSYFVKYRKKQEFLIRVKYDNNIINVPFEEYIVGVVAAEMPAQFESDALKAQAVASRSYVLKKIEKNANNDYDILGTVQDQVYLSNDKLKEKYKDNYDKYLKKIKKAVYTTKGEYLTYKGDIVEAFFFSTSSGNTENSEDVFVTSLPYLRSVDSSWDKSSPVFKNQISYTLKEFYNNIGLAYNSTPNIEVLEKSNTGHVKKIKVDDTIYKGTDFRKLLNLKSTYFNFRIEKDKIYFNTQGNGHGVGMSQYGANYMALDGYNYKDILRHYYKDTEISKINV